MLKIILRILKPFQIILQRLGYIESDFTEEHINNIINNIQHGDIILSYESGRFTSLFIKGEWDHAAIVNSELDIIEAVGDKIINGVNSGGVRKVPIKQWLWKKNHIVILRHKTYWSSLKASVKCNSYIGLRYDYSFSQDNNFLYCSELVYISYKPYDKQFMSQIDENDRILPIDYLNEPSLREIYNSRKDLLFFSK